MPYREEDRIPRFQGHGRLDPETVAHLMIDDIRRIQDNQAKFHDRQEDFDDRLSRVERIREMVWQAVRFLFKDGLKIAAAIIIIIMVLSGRVTIDQVIQLVQAFNGKPHHEESHSPDG